MQETEFIPVKKVLNIINSCETEKQLKSCKKLIDIYVAQTKSKGISNPELLYKRLLKEFKQKSFQISMIKLFIKEARSEFYHEEIKNNIKIIA